MHDVLSLPDATSYENPLFKIAFLNDQNTLKIGGLALHMSGCHMSCLDYHFVKLDLVGSGFLNASSV